MRLPKTFETMTLAFHQDTHLVYGSLEELCDAAVLQVDVADRGELARFLDRILADGSGACREAWDKSRAEIGFENTADLMSLLREILARL